MSQVRIKTLGNFSTYGDSPKGDYLVTIEGDDRELKLFHDTSGSYDAPRVGDEFEGEVVPAKGKAGGWRLTRSKGAAKQGGGGDKNFDRRPEHPRNEARMIHTSALSAAPAYYELLRTEGVIPQAENKAALLNTLTGIARWLADSYQEALSATEGLSQAPSNGGGEVPADMEGLTPVSDTSGNTADDQIPF